MTDLERQWHLVADLEIAEQDRRREDERTRLWLSVARMRYFHAAAERCAFLDAACRGW